MSARDPRNLRAEEIEAASQASPEAYLALLQRRLAERPAILDPEILEQVLAERPWQDALRPVAAPILGLPATPPQTVLFVNTFHRVPTAAAETVLASALRLRRGGLHTALSGRDMSMDRLTALREFRPNSLVRGHVVGTVRVRALLALFGISPILMVRDIFDTIASYADDRTDPRMPGFGSYRLAALDPVQRHRILTMRMASHLVDFYASWAAAHTAGRCILHRWEDVRRDWPGFIAARLAEQGRDPDRAEIAAQLATLPPQPHAEPGQGATLSDDNKALVRALYLQYPATDFRPIDAGAPPPTS